MSLLNEIWKKYFELDWEDPIDSLSTWKWNKIKQRKIDIKEKIYKLIDYGIVNESNYLVLKNWWKYNRKKMSDKKILEYIINYHKDLDIDWMVKHILEFKNSNW
jgi:hypothetical protein